MDGKRAYLVLANGKTFEGRRIGAARDAVGEVVFNTGMVGYIERVSDPRSVGHIVAHTFPLVGNYGAMEEDIEGAAFASGVVVRELCDEPSNFRSGSPLGGFLERHDIPGICGIDTRELTRIIREEGAMNGAICSEVPSDLSRVRSFALRGAVASVSTREPKKYAASGERRVSAVVVDYGALKSMIRALNDRGAELTVVPHDTDPAEILAMSPDGVILSSGPGDPADDAKIIERAKGIIGHVPVFGVGLGHQIAALALGGRTTKLHCGHRGANQPVRDVLGARTYVTSQDHGYAVVASSLAGIGEQSFVSLNDDSNEGMDYPGLRCFTVQFCPDGAEGAGGTSHIYDRFISMMEDERNAKG